jgi:DNA-binding response OmpR family regulator
MPSPSARVLLASHRLTLREAMAQQLTLEACAPVAAANARAVLQAVDARFDLIVLDLDLPAGGGSTLCRRIRALGANAQTPILLVAEPAAARDALAALEQCADDWLALPFGLREFVARARALMRRSRAHGAQPIDLGAPPPVVRDRLVIDPARRRVNVDGRDVKLTVNEFQLLYTLAARAGVVFDREALLSEVWGTHTFVTVRSVDALVKRVRRQLDSAEPELDYLVTVRGVGYKFEDAASAS